MAAATAASKVGLKGLMKVVWMVVTKAYLLVDMRVDVMVVWTAAMRAESSAAKMVAL